MRRWRFLFKKIKNILLELISTNYIEDKRWSDTLNKSVQNLSDAEIFQVHENLDLTWGGIWLIRLDYYGNKK